MPTHSIAFAINRLNLRNETEQNFPLNLCRPFASPPPKWTLWRFDCRDFPNHCTVKTCAFCAEVNKLRPTAKNIVNETHVRWDSYLKREKSFDDAPTLLRMATDTFLPSKLTKSVFFNHKLGVAIFRDEIPPKFESVENLSGGIFQLYLHGTSGRQSAVTVQKFDALFIQTVRSLFGMPSPIACHVHGLFYRCEINPGNRRDPISYGNLLDLPFMAKFEIWIDDVANRRLIEQSFIAEIKNQIKAEEIPIRLPFRFNPNNLRAKKIVKSVKSLSKK
ncbi:hypothetical protein niasHT_004785 [Heterodera trifolii]|uniref:Uncharacterized protein n=1 Tax=Heterodera trifolii TaxID=157864 RepID=A0ABD2M9S4_9BILA